jgi:hypothetical protein
MKNIPQIPWTNQGFKSPDFFYLLYFYSSIIALAILRHSSAQALHWIAQRWQ